MDWTTAAIGKTEGTLILPLFEGIESPPNNSLIGLSRTTSAMVKAAVASDDFKGKKGNKLSIWGESVKVVLVGVGKKDVFDAAASRIAGAKALSSLGKQHGKKLVVRFTAGWKTDTMAAFGEGMLLRDYEFDQYISKDEEEDEEDEEDYFTTFQCIPSKVDNLNSELSRLAAIVTGVHLARDLANAPSNDLYPETWSTQAVEWAKGKKGAKVEVIDWDGLLEDDMGGLINVGKGSARKPAMVIFELNKPRKKSQPAVIVGKGITFDSGGISIKPSPGMGDMKFDMHGSATVFGLAQALYESNSKKHVVIIACLAENMPDGEAQRPGDIIKTYSGKTVEVLNTDAEGRLVLADGLWKAGEYDPAYIIDLATLTGAIVIALGHEASGVWSNDGGLLDSLQEAARSVDETVWPMPLFPKFTEEVKETKVADLKNLGNREGGSNSAAAFLEQFVPERGEGDDKKSIPWAHIDIAGTAWGAKSNPFVAHGGSGIHVRTLVNLIENTD